MGHTLSIRKNDSKVFPNPKNRKSTNIISYVNSNKSNILNTSNSDNIIGTSKMPHRNVQNGSSFITLSNLQKVIDTESSVSIND